MADINVGKFINNLDTEDLTSEKLQGVVNNVYAKAIKDHKKTAKIAEDNLEDKDKETVEFIKSNHDRLKANKEKVAKEINENKSVRRPRKNITEEKDGGILPGDVYNVLIKEVPAEDIDHHLSDLYVRKTPKSTEIMNRLTIKSLLSTFRSQIDGDIWYELPFCYSPHFEKNESRKVNEAASPKELYYNKEEALKDIWGLVCEGDDRLEDIRYIFESGLLKPNEFRYNKFGAKHSLIMGALRNGNYKTVELLKSLGEKILKSEVEEYKDIMAKRVYSDETVRDALDENKIVAKFQVFYDKVKSDRQLAKQVDYLYAKVLKTLHYDMDEIRKEVKNRALEDKVAEILEHTALISDQPNSKLAKELNALLDESLKEDYGYGEPVAEKTFGRWRLVVKPSEWGDHKLAVSFYDTEQDPEKFPGGQHTGATYYVDTLLSDDWTGPSIRNMGVLSLWRDIPEWTVYHKDLVKIADWLEQFQEKKTESLDEGIDNNRITKIINLYNRKLITKQEAQKMIDDLFVKENGSLSDIDNGNDSVMQWYVDSFQDDELGKEIPKDTTFQDIVDALNNHRDVYDLLGNAADSIIRERIFNEIAKRLNVDYDDIYNKWLEEAVEIRKKSLSLKESTETIDTRLFAKLVKYSDPIFANANYGVLNDGNFVYKFWADNDEEAKKIFQKYGINKPTLDANNELIERNLTKSERANRDANKIFSYKRATDDAMKNFLIKNGVPEEEAQKLWDDDKLLVKIDELGLHDKFFELWFNNKVDYDRFGNIQWKEKPWLGEDLTEARHFDDKVSNWQHIASVDLYSSGVSEEEQKKKETFGGHYEIDLDNKVFTKVKENTWLSNWRIESYPRDTWEEVEQTAKNIMSDGNFREVSNEEYLKIQKEWEEKGFPTR